MKNGFTLIELSIALVIIGLIVGGVLVGRDLLSSAAARAQISQIEQYRTAANTFRGKYGYLPGDIKNPEATQFGFVSRGSFKGEGDGNGFVQGILANSANQQYDFSEFQGEEAMFWVDLSAAHLIEGAFTTATPTAIIGSTVSGTGVDRYFPRAKIAAIAYVYAWSGGWKGYNLPQDGDGANYLAVTGVTGVVAGTGGVAENVPAMTVSQAYSIDKKIDDGLPQSGQVLAMDGGSEWASGGPVDNSTGIPWVNAIGDFDLSTYGPITSATSSPWYDTDNGVTLAQTCYNNGHTLLVEHYSIEIAGSSVNCTLSFRLQ